MIKKNKYQNFKNNIILFVLLMSSTFLYSQPPVLDAGTTSRQAFCQGNAIKIAPSFTITDPVNSTIEEFFIQISSGYQTGFDRLQLDIASHPNVLPVWNATEGKLTLLSRGSGTSMLLTDLENAIRDAEFITTAINIFPEKAFSFSIDAANYLPLTNNFYQFVPVLGITWSDAKIAAESSQLYGRPGYLATLTSQEEANFAGKQAAGVGWIGGSDEDVEGEWKWVTGPEAGTVFWNGDFNGNSPPGQFAFWNRQEPNQDGNEDYAHITDNGVANVIPGAWNDLRDEGGVGLYAAKGYIVEYGVPTDPILSIVATTSIFVPQITSTQGATRCESGSVTISAVPSDGDIAWFTASSGGTPVATGSSFTTPVLAANTVYFAAISLNGCISSQRTQVFATINQKPTITSSTDDLICSGTAVLRATASAGQIDWYDSLTSTTPIFTGANFTTPNLTSTQTYYVEAKISDCNSATRTAVTAVVDNKIPEFNVMQNTYVLCNDVGSIMLETINPQANYNYVWKKEGEVISGNLATISVNSVGNYTVKAISLAGCESEEKNISVVNSEKATITKNDFIIVDDSINNTIYVNNPDLGIGDYEFALDDEFSFYRSVGFFENISPGIHTLFIKDKLGCGTQEYQFSILAYPKFFTPNEDGENDIWKIEGYDKDFYTISEVYIYDRFGKLMYVIDKNSEGWNGDFQGKKASTNDYWFKTVLTDINGYSIEKMGNFSLIRK